MKEKAEEARFLLSVISLDLTACTNLKWFVDKYQEMGTFNSGTAYCFEHMLLNNAILSLYKWLEFYKVYRNVIPVHARDKTDKINSWVSELNLKQYRNKYIGHILDTDTNKPLDRVVAQKHYRRITGNDVGEFMLKINTLSKDNYGETFVGICEEVRQIIVDEYGLPAKL